jgi:PAS domain S-box-containing protein
MARPLRVLFVEDREKDVELLVLELRRGGYDLVQERVDTPEAFDAALDRQGWDIILCDYRMPRFSATAALALVKEKNVDLPFIVVSGTVSEEIAVEALRTGAHDFMTKGKLSRLLPAIDRELREARSRTERKTERRKAEEARRRLVSILDATSDLVATADPHGRALYINRAGRLMLGLVADGDLPDLSIGDTHPKWAASIVLDKGIPAAIRDGVWSGETAFLRRDGKEIPVSQVIIAHKDSNGNVEFLSTIGRDVSETRLLEEQLRQSQKMEAVGRLAGGIAHDFNNLLTVISSTAELAARELREGDPLRAELAAIGDAGARAAALTRQLLAFSRKQVLHPTVVDLNTLVANVEAMLRRVIGEDIDLVARPGQGLASVKVDPGQIEQVILNLAINSRDAMPNGGTLTIETGNVLLDETYAKSHAGAQPGPQVMLAISDTGSGMDEATRQRVFEPFFTTKVPGKGTGLGLSTAYGIIKQSGGYIWVYSELGIGTTFKIYLPQVEEAPRESRPAAVVAAARGSERILIVEDEESLRGVAGRILESAGYTVLVAGTGAEALRLLERHLGRVHLLLTDVVMPGMNGRDLAKRLEVSHPEIKILYTSGYSDDAIASNGMLDEGVHFIGKPYTIAELTHKVREVLDS